MIFSGFIGFNIIDSGDASTAKTLHVGGTGAGNYSSIASALAAANSGDTIFVHAGTYFGTITMKTNVDIIGEDSNTTIIDAQGNGCGVYGDSNSVLDGFALKNFRYNGISCDKNNNVEIRNSIISCDNKLNNPSGVILHGSSIKIENVTIVALNLSSNGGSDGVITTDTGLCTIYCYITDTDNIL